MTAETLKPFIIPQTGDNFPVTHSNKSCDKIGFLTISFSLICTVLAAILIGYSIWNTLRVNKLEIEIMSLNRHLESIQKELNLNNEDKINDFEKEYFSTFLGAAKDTLSNNNKKSQNNNEYIPKMYDEKNDGYEDQLSDEYADNYDVMKKFDNYEDEEQDDNENVSDGDLYIDFEKYKDSKQKKQRNLRSTTTLVTNASKDKEYKLFREAKHLHKTTKSILRQHSNIDIKKTFADNEDHNKSPLPQSKRKVPIVKSGKSRMHSRQISRTPAAHFHLNRKIPDRYADIRINAYPGDTYIGHPSWTSEHAIENYFKLENGVLKVLEPGVYYIYAQVCYNNTHDQNGFVIFHEQEPFLQCLNTVPTNIPLKIHTCHTSGIIELQENESIHIRDFHSDRNVILKDINNRSYFGIIKI